MRIYEHGVQILPTLCPFQSWNLVSPRDLYLGESRCVAISFHTPVHVPRTEIHKIRALVNAYQVPFRFAERPWRCARTRTRTRARAHGTRVYASDVAVKTSRERRAKPCRRGSLPVGVSRLLNLEQTRHGEPVINDDRVNFSEHPLGESRAPSRTPLIFISQLEPRGRPDPS